MVVVRDHCRLVVDDGIPIMVSIFGNSYVKYTIVIWYFWSQLCLFYAVFLIIYTATETKKVHWRHIRTSDALQLLLTLEHAHIFSAIVTTTASNQLGMFYVLLLVVNFNCVHERPVNTTSSVSLNSLVFFLLVDPKKHVQTAEPDLQSLNSSSRCFGDFQNFL